LDSSKTISENYRKANEWLHQQPRGFGGDGGKHVEKALELIETYKAKHLLDYGAGQCRLSYGLMMAQIGLEDKTWLTNYDPAIPLLNERPTYRHDLVFCTDVLEHIEPEYLDAVLADIKRLMGKAGYFVICCQPANKTLPDGRNAHLIIEKPVWWLQKIQQAGFIIKGVELIQCKEAGKEDQTKRMNIVLEPS